MRSSPKLRPAKAKPAPLRDGNPFNTPLSEPLRTRRGAELATILDAAVFIDGLDPSLQKKPYWDHCAAQLLKAVKSRDPDDVREATRCVRAALEKENWIR